MTTTHDTEGSAPSGPTILRPTGEIEPFPHLPIPDYEQDTEERLIRGGRRDLTVKIRRDRDAATETNVVANLRRFFMAVDQEAERYKNDPITNVQALAKVEALLSDLRYLRNTLQNHVARAMHYQRIRVLTVEGSVTVEAATESKRTDWQHQRLLAAVLAVELDTVRVIDADGQFVPPAVLAEALLTYFRPEWRLTPLRDAGIDPDAYSTIEMDDGDPPKPVRTPTLRIVSNREREA